MKKIAVFLFFLMFLPVCAFAFPISEGDKSGEVFNLQVALIASDFLDDDADGEFGPNTKDAVIKAQKEFDFEETGAVGYGLYNLIIEHAYKIGGAKDAKDSDEVRIGSRGSKVKEVQRLLAKLNYYSGEQDGVAGTQTAVAIAKFQKRAGLKASGIADDKTQRALKDSTGDSTERKGKKTMTMHATAYSPQDPGVKSYTATKTKLRKGVVAVDPKVIPLGSKLYIEGYGEAVAEDVGRSIKGNRIDLAFDTHKEALNFGRRNVKVTILN